VTDQTDVSTAATATGGPWPPSPIEALPVLVGVDGSEDALGAVRWAAGAARQRQTSLLVIHAWLWPLYQVSLDPPPGRPQAGLRNQAQAVLTQARDAALQHSPGLSVDTELLTGDAGHVLVRSSRRAQLLVVASRGLGGFAGVLLGSVGMRAAAGATCPVTIIRGNAHRAGPVVVGVDGSPGSEAALHLAFEEAQRQHCPLVAIHTWESPMSPVVVPQWQKDRAAMHDAARQVLATSVDPWLAKYPSVPAEQRLVDAGAASTLVDASRTARALVLGSHGRGAVLALVLGSVTHAAVHHAHCPVVIAPKTDRS